MIYNLKFILQLTMIKIISLWKLHSYYMAVKGCTLRHYQLAAPCSICYYNYDFPVNSGVGLHSCYWEACCNIVPNKADFYSKLKRLTLHLSHQLNPSHRLSYLPACPVRGVLSATQKTWSTWTTVTLQVEIMYIIQYSKQGVKILVFTAKK